MNKFSRGSPEVSSISRKGNALVSGRKLGHFVIKIQRNYRKHFSECVAIEKLNNYDYHQVSKLANK